MTRVSAKKYPPTCYCSSYAFPHRLGSGSCQTIQGEELCGECGQPAEFSRFSGQSNCCGALPVPNDARRLYAPEKHS